MREIALVLNPKAQADPGDRGRSAAENWIAACGDQLLFGSSGNGGSNLADVRALG